MSFWFANILVHHPYIILISVAVFSGTCVIIPFTLKTFPNFSDPQMGFETRGTILASRVTAWKNLVEATKPSGRFAVNPKEILFIKQNNSIYYKPKQKKSFRKKKKGFKLEGRVDLYIKKRRNYTKDNIDKIHDLLMSNNFTGLRGLKRRKEGFFCGPPDDTYSHIVLKSKSGRDLLNLESLFTMCRIEHEFIQTDMYSDLCITSTKHENQCCRPWSIANYIALLNNRTSCLGLEEEDITRTKKLLEYCSYYFYTLKISPDCSWRGHCQAPTMCTNHDAVYNILNYLTPAYYYAPNSTLRTLEETIIFLPMACSSAALPYFHNIEDLDLDFGDLAVVAMEFGLKHTLFDECLLKDTWLMFSGSIFVMGCIWLYTESIFLTLMTITAIIFSLGISYFMYMLVFDLKFFPFMNLLAIIVAIGIGADDAFIFCKVWSSNKDEEDKTYLRIMTGTLYHAYFSMFVTSITTATAFIASFVSTITAVRCFSIFASIAVMANCLLMMSWFPACVVTWEKLCTSHYEVFKKFVISYLDKWSCVPYLKNVMNKIKEFCTNLDNIWVVKEKNFLEYIITFRYIWFISLTLIAIISAFIVFYYPKLQLPNSSEFQLFRSSHPFEQYDLIYKKKFWFRRSVRMNGDVIHAKMPLRFVWGVKPVDNGNYLDPQSYGTLELDKTFDIADPRSQQWLLDFCRSIRRQRFYQSTLGPLLPNCFIESFKAWMERRCNDPFDNIDRSPCCESEKFPYNRSVFDYCIVDAIGDLYNTPSDYFIPGMAGPKFSTDDQNPTIKAIVVEYDSNYSYSMSYEYMRDFITEVEVFMIRQLETAPSSMKGGWFVSEVQFYDLQKVLSDGSLAAIGFAMGFALLVLFLSTLNLLTSLYAIFTITCSILVIIAVLVLLGWKLNILESIAVSTAIGLTVDFSLHYTINYRLCPLNMCEDRIKATRFALSNMFGPSLMAAVTTGTAGVFMLPSSILPYIQIGSLLVTVMSISWIYATFHLGSTLAIVGPEREFGQYYYSNLKVCCGKKPRQQPMARTNSFNLLEAHEMQSLTNKDSIRRPSETLQRSYSGNRNPNNRFTLSDQSPSATSAITIIVAEDN